MSHRKCKRLADVLFVLVLALGFCHLVDAQQAESVPPKPGLYSLNTAISKGVVSTRMSLFNATDQKHVLDTIQGLDPGMIYATYVGVWGTIRQQDLNSAEQLAGKLRQLLPHTILGGGVNESMSLAGKMARYVHCARYVFSCMIALALAAVTGTLPLRAQVIGSVGLVCRCDSKRNTITQITIPIISKRIGDLPLVGRRGCRLRFIAET